MFQFQTGAIKRSSIRVLEIQAGRGFNSKLVRLKVNEAAQLHRRTMRFQFQTGAIKSQTSKHLISEVYVGFNSKLVRLKVRSQFDLRMIIKCFNSKLVRLKGFDSGLAFLKSGRFNSKLVRLKGALFQYLWWWNRVFQFQTGAIKSIGSAAFQSRATHRFNSKLVRLKVKQAEDSIQFES